MKIIKANYIIEDFYPHTMLKNIERAGKTCYKSENTITDDVTSAEEFIKMIIKKGHESVLEHEKITVRIICDRAITHELVRHRIASYSQESTRYCNYAKEGFGNEITVIDIREHIDKTMRDAGSSHKAISIAIDKWQELMFAAEEAYKDLIKLGVSPQLARSVLPNSLKTEIVITANLREWRHIFRMRASKAAHPQMREIMVPLLKDFKEKLPVIFEDIKVED